ncbi:hypothetical protein FHE73_15345 [Bacillus thuringiensis]|nr:hypothetical protein CGQ22_11700 [Bacillus sp. M13(2017)]QCY64589.1 hypothetical protein FHE73_15345 [Bacillus thuringiensis]
METDVVSLSKCIFYCSVTVYPPLTGSKTPPQNSAKAKKLGGGSTAHKSPIGSTNNQWGMNKTPTD